MKLIITSFLLFFLGVAAIAQETFTFDYIEGRLDESEVVEEEVRKHYLGNVVARKMILVNQSYVFYEEVSTKNPLPTRQVDKYAIYTSVKKLSSYYKKSVKAGIYSKDEAQLRFKKVLDIALCVRYQNTTDMEAVLLKTKDPVVLDDFFASKIILDGLYDETITRVE